MPAMSTPWVQLTSAAAAQGNGDAITDSAEISDLPNTGTIMSVKVMDLGKQSVNMDVELWNFAFTDTDINSPYDPDDTEVTQGWHDSVLIDTWKAYNDSSMGVEHNVTMPYWTNTGSLYVQLVTRGTPTPASTTDYLIQLGIVYP